VRKHAVNELKMIIIQIKTPNKNSSNKDISLDKSRHSVISEHILNCNHRFDWEKIEILDTESNYNKRLVSEILHIKKQKNGINSPKDTEFLEVSYYCLLNNFSSQD